MSLIRMKTRPAKGGRAPLRANGQHASDVWSCEPIIVVLALLSNTLRKEIHLQILYFQSREWAGI